MAKFCKYCGSELTEDALFCANCGKKVEEEAPKEEAPKAEVPKTEYRKSNNTAGITERNIALSIIFCFVTCGIYGWYWMYKLNDEMNQLTDDTAGVSGGMVILLSILTCGIYSWFWFYKMGQKTDELNGNGSNGVLFIVLAIFQLSIVNFAIMQDAVNAKVA